MFPELLLYLCHQKQCVMKKINENNTGKLTYIYIATTEQLRKQNMFKIGYADDVNRRMSDLHGYASFKKDKWYALHTYETVKMTGMNPDHEFHKWLEEKYGVKLMTVDEIRMKLNLNSNDDVHEKELYYGISSDIDISVMWFDHRVREFLGIDLTSKNVRTSWCIPASRTPREIADRMIGKLLDVNPKFFDFSFNENLKVCDFACKDASFANALLDTMFAYNNGMSKSKSAAKKLIEDILSEHIFAYCLDSERENIMAGIRRHITSNPNIYKKIDGNKLDDKIFRNFTVEYMEEYGRDTMDSKLDMLSGNKRRFDAVVMNPPYSTTGGGNLHLDFTKAALEIADNVVSLFPFSFVKRTGRQYEKYNDAFDDRLLSVEEVSSKIFSGTNMQNVGVYNFVPYNDSVITVVDLSGSTEIIKSLSDSDIIKEESELFDAVKSVGHIDHVALLRDGRNIKKLNPNLSTADAQIIKCNELAVKQSNKFNSKKVCLVASAISGANDKFNGKIISQSSGQICDTVESLKDVLVNVTAHNYCGLFVNSIKAAKQLKQSCHDNLIRFLIYRSQKDRRITAKTLDSIPNIDWSDPKAKTDQGILELCGMAPDRAKYWADYCADKIYQVDHGKRV